MTAILRQMNKSLTPAQKVSAKLLSQDIKRIAKGPALSLVRDNLIGVAGRSNTELRHLLSRNLWAAAENLAREFDKAGGARFMRSAGARMLSEFEINDPRLVELEHKHLVKLLGDSTVRKLRLGPRNLQQMFDEAAHDDTYTLIDRNWSLEAALMSCGCRPGAKLIADADLALYSYLKWVAITALIAADILAFSSGGTIGLGIASLAMAGRLANRAC